MKDQQSPPAVAQLLAAYRKLVPPTAEGRVDMSEACKVFIPAKAEKFDTSPDRLQAIATFEKLLCSAQQ